MSMPPNDTRSLLEQFLDTNVLKGSTINYITSPFSDPALFAVIIFLFALLVFLAFVAIRKDFTRPALVRAAVFSFMLAAALAAVRMDANWLSMLRSDHAKLSIKDIDERVVAFVGFDFKHFIEFARKTIPAGEKARWIENDPWDLTYSLTKLGNYYLLPKLTSTEGRFIWVYGFTDYDYDPSTGTLRVYDSYFRARLYATYSKDAHVFEIMDNE